MAQRFWNRPLGIWQTTSWRFWIPSCHYDPNCQPGWLVWSVWWQEVVKREGAFPILPLVSLSVKLWVYSALWEQRCISLSSTMGGWKAMRKDTFPRECTASELDTDQWLVPDEWCALAALAKRVGLCGVWCAWRVAWALCTQGRGNGVSKDLPQRRQDGHWILPGQ